MPSALTPTEPLIFAWSCRHLDRFPIRASPRYQPLSALCSLLLVLHPRESMRIELISINIPCAIDVADTHTCTTIRESPRPAAACLCLLVSTLSCLTTPWPQVGMSQRCNDSLVGRQPRQLQPRRPSRIDTGEHSHNDTAAAYTTVHCGKPMRTVPGRTQVRAFTPSAGSRRCR